MPGLILPCAGRFFAHYAIFLAACSGGLAVDNGVLFQDVSKVEVPPFDSLMEKITAGSIPERETSTAWLVEYPDRVDDFAEAVAGAFIQHDESLQRAARRLFAWLGEAALPEVERLFPSHSNRSLEENVKWRKACGMIHAIGEPARATFEPRLLQLLDESTDPNVRVPVIYALTGFSHGSPDAIEKILGELKDDDFNISLTACRLIIKTGPPAQVAVNDLRDLLANGNLSQRTFAAWALGAIGPTDEYDPLADLKTMLGKYTLAERDRALAGIGLVGESAIELEPRVREMMMKPGTNLEPHAAFVLWQISGSATDSVGRLIELAGSLDYEIVALDYLGQIGAAAEPAIEFLVERSKSADYSVRVAALEALNSIGGDSEIATGRIEALQFDPHPVVRLSAKLAKKRGSE